MEPWDYTLYRAADGSLFIKVVFSEGDYKIDVGRFFRLPPADEKSATEDAMDLAARIRSDYPNVAYEKVEKSSLKIIE